MNVGEYIFLPLHLLSGEICTVYSKTYSRKRLFENFNKIAASQ